MTRSRFWMIVTIVGCLGIVAIGWLFGAAPQLAARAAADDQRTTVEAQNDVHRAKTVALEKQFAEMDSTRAKLAGLRTELPEGVEYADFTEQIAEIATRHSVEVVQYTSDEAISPIGLQDALVEAAPVTEAAPDTTASADAPADTGSDATAAALAKAGTDGADSADAAAIPAVSPAVSVPAGVSARLTANNLYAIPVSLSLKGTVADVLAVIAELQSGSRLFLMTATTVSLDESSAVKGYVFVVTDDATAATAGGDETGAETADPADASAIVN